MIPIMDEDVNKKKIYEKYNNEIDAFLESPYKMAYVEIEGDCTLNSERCRYETLLRRRKMKNIKVCQRNFKLALIKIEEV